MAKRGAAERAMSEVGERIAGKVTPEVADSGQHPSAACAAVDLSNRCPTCLVEMDWIHSYYQCPRCGWRDS